MEENREKLVPLYSNQDIYNAMVSGSGVVIEERNLNWDILQKRNRPGAISVGAIVLYAGDKYVVIYDDEGNVNKPNVEAEKYIEPEIVKPKLKESEGVVANLGDAESLPVWDGDDIVEDFDAGL